MAQAKANLFQTSSHLSTMSEMSGASPANRSSPRAVSTASNAPPSSAAPSTASTRLHVGVWGSGRIGKVDTRRPGKENSNFYGARPVRQIISMIKWIQTSWLSIKNSLSLGRGGESVGFGVEREGEEVGEGGAPSPASTMLCAERWGQNDVLWILKSIIRFTRLRR